MGGRVVSAIDWPKVQMLTKAHSTLVSTGVEFKQTFRRLLRQDQSIRPLATVAKQFDALDQQLSRAATHLIGDHPAYRWLSGVGGVGRFSAPALMAEIGVRGMARVRFPDDLVPGWNDARWVPHPSRLPPPDKFVRGGWRDWISHGCDGGTRTKQRRELRALRILWHYPQIGSLEIIESRWGIACFPTRSSLYRLCGLHVVFDEARGWVAPERRPGHPFNWSPRLRSILSAIGSAAACHDGYLHVAYSAEMDRQARTAPDISHAHAAARARRHVAKLLVRMLWQVWRTVEGHPVIDEPLSWEEICKASENRVPFTGRETQPSDTAVTEIVAHSSVSK